MLKITALGIYWSDNSGYICTGVDGREMVLRLESQLVEWDQDSTEYFYDNFSSRSADS